MIDLWTYWVSLLDAYLYRRTFVCATHWVLWFCDICALDSFSMCLPTPTIKLWRSLHIKLEPAVKGAFVSTPGHVLEHSQTCQIYTYRTLNNFSSAVLCQKPVFEQKPMMPFAPYLALNCSLVVCPLATDPHHENWSVRNLSKYWTQMMMIPPLQVIL